jgi:HEAT repeat protein
MIFPSPKLQKLVENKDVGGLIKALREKNSSDRSNAASALGQLGDPGAVEPLCQSLQDGESEVRSSAANALGKIRDSRAVEPLCAMLKDPDFNVRLAAVKALGLLGDARAVDTLCAAHGEDANRLFQSEIVRSLAKVGDQRAVPILCHALRDADGRVSADAARALGRIGDPRALEPLCAALPDSRTTVQICAAMALAQIGNAQAIEPLIGMLTGGRRPYPIRRVAAAAVGRIGGAQAVEALAAAAKNRNPEAAAAAAEMLARFGDPRALEPCCSALKHENRDVRRFSAEALGLLGDPRAVESLAKAIHFQPLSPFPEEWRAGAAACRSLAKIGGLAARTELEGVLSRSGWKVQGEDWQVVCAAAEGLAGGGDSRAVEALRAAFMDDDREKHFAAAEALARSGDRSMFDMLATQVTLDKESKTPPLNQLRKMHRAVEALARLDDLIAVGVLSGILKNRDIDSETKISALKTLSEIGDPSTIDSVLSGLDGLESSDPFFDVYNLFAAAIAKEIQKSEPIGKET